MTTREQTGGNSRSSPRTSRTQARLTRTEILDVALSVMDGGGAEALSLRRLGQELGVTARTLYGYFDSKEQLESALISRAIPMPPVVPRGDGSREEALFSYLLDVHDAIVRHPGVAQLFIARSTSDPVTNRVREYLLTLLLDGDVEVPEAVAAVGILSRYLLGCFTIAVGRAGPAQRIDETLPGDEFPLLRRVAGQYAARNSRDATVDGMRLIIGALFGSRPTVRPDPAPRLIQDI